MTVAGFAGPRPGHCSCKRCRRVRWKGLSALLMLLLVSSQHVLYAAAGHGRFAEAWAGVKLLDHHGSYEFELRPGRYHDDSDGHEHPLRGCGHNCGNCPTRHACHRPGCCWDVNPSRSFCQSANNTTVANNITGLCEPSSNNVSSTAGGTTGGGGVTISGSCGYGCYNTQAAPQSLPLAGAGRHMSRKLFVTLPTTYALQCCDALYCGTGCLDTLTCALACSLCDYGSYSSDGTASTCTKCPAGQSTCHRGTFQSTACLNNACPVNNYFSESLSSCTALPGGKERDGPCSYKPCLAGYYRGANMLINTCQPCPAGQYAPTTGSTACQSCTAPHWSNPGSSGCNSCILGYKWLGGSLCAPCDKGTYGTSYGYCGGKCPSGLTTAGTGKTSISDCIMVLPGWWVAAYDYNSGIMTLDRCPKGTYRAGEALADSIATATMVGCTECPGAPLVSTRYNTSTSSADCKVLNALAPAYPTTAVPDSSCCFVNSQAVPTALTTFATSFMVKDSSSQSTTASVLDTLWDMGCPRVAPADISTTAYTNLPAECQAAFSALNPSSTTKYIMLRFGVAGPPLTIGMCTAIRPCTGTILIGFTGLCADFKMGPMAGTICLSYFGYDPAKSQSLILSASVFSLTAFNNGNLDYSQLVQTTQLACGVLVNGSVDTTIGVSKLVEVALSGSVALGVDYDPLENGVNGDFAFMLNVIAIPTITVSQLTDPNANATEPVFQVSLGTVTASLFIRSLSANDYLVQLGVQLHVSLSDMLDSLQVKVGSLGLVKVGSHINSMLSIFLAANFTGNAMVTVQTNGWGVMLAGQGQIQVNIADALLGRVGADLLKAFNPFLDKIPGVREVLGVNITFEGGIILSSSYNHGPRVAIYTGGSNVQKLPALCTHDDECQANEACFLLFCQPKSGPGGFCMGVGYSNQCSSNTCDVFICS